MPNDRDLRRSVQGAQLANGRQAAESGPDDCDAFHNGLPLVISRSVSLGGMIRLAWLGAKGRYCRGPGEWLAFIDASPQGILYGLGRG